MTTERHRYGLTIALLLGTAIAARLIDARPEEALAEPLESINMRIGEWNAEPDPPLREDVLESLAPTSYVSRTYRRGHDTINLFVSYYANQKAGESMHSPRHCLPGAGWEIVSHGSLALPSGEGTVSINRHVIQKDGARMVVLYWYQSKRRVVADEYLAKVFLVRDAVMERRTGGAIVRIICRDDGPTLKNAAEFGSALLGEVNRCMSGGEAIRTGSR